MQTMNYRIVMSDNDICHYGIPEQRWGVRRYQNADGTLTEEGRRRYYGDRQNDIDREYYEEDRRYRKEERRKKLRYAAATALTIATGAALVASMFGSNSSIGSQAQQASRQASQNAQALSTALGSNSSSSSTQQQTYRTWVHGTPNPPPASKGPKVYNAKFKPYTEPKPEKFKASKVSSSMFKGKDNIIDADVTFDSFVSDYGSSGESYTTSLLSSYGSAPLLTDNSFYPPDIRYR